jgi:hypothetical protein
MTARGEGGGPHLHVRVQRAGAPDVGARGERRARDAHAGRAQELQVGIC